MTKTAAIEIESEIQEAANRAYEKSERTILTRAGKPLAGMIPIEDLEFIEAVEEKERQRNEEAAKRHGKRNGRTSKE